jgi:hypothetical protein
MTGRPTWLCLSALALAACAAGAWHPISYAPPIVEVPLASTSVLGSQVRALATILGVARAREGLPERVLASLRVENLGTVTARVPADGFGLVAGDLAAFGPATVRGEAAPIPPSGSGLIEVWFPLPEGRGADDVDWTGLNLRFAVEFEGSRVTTGATFTRSDFPYGYGEPRMHVGLGFGSAVR